MNSETSKTYKILNEIGVELSTYSKYLHETLLTKFINERLAETLKTYDLELEKTTTFLASQSAMRVLKAIAKKRKQCDKEIIEQYLED